MRTVILLAGILIHEALNNIAKTNGFKSVENDSWTSFLAVAFLVVMTMDIIDFFRGI